MSLIDFQELCIFAVPLVNYHALKRRISNLFSWQKNPRNRGVAFTAGCKCAECNETPVLPHHMGCGHIFCFYCIKVRNYFFVCISTLCEKHVESAVCCALCVPRVCVMAQIQEQESHLKCGVTKKQFPWKYDPSMAVPLFLQLYGVTKTVLHLPILPCVSVLACHVPFVTGDCQSHVLAWNS